VPDYGPALRKKFKEMDAATAALETDVTTLQAATATKPLAQIGIPALTPSFVGQLYIDTSTGTTYIATGATSGDWTAL
jgi:hypothetical protein